MKKTSDEQHFQFFGKNDHITFFWKKCLSEQHWNFLEKMTTWRTFSIFRKKGVDDRHLGILREKGEKREVKIKFAI